MHKHCVEGGPVRMSMRAAVEKRRGIPGNVWEGSGPPLNRCRAGIKFVGDAADDTNSITINERSGTGHARHVRKEWRGIKMYFFGLHFFARVALSPQNDSGMQRGIRRGNSNV